MKKLNILFLALLIIFSCNTKPENKTLGNASTHDTLVPIQVIVQAALPDSLQSKIILLDNMPKPKTVLAGKGETKMLAVLQNLKSQPILDPEGKPFIMGNGGNSNFTNFTTDDGLALDATTCSIMDAAGNLWFGTQGGGVSRYDGKSFTNFTTAHGLANNIVISATEDKFGNLWFGTQGGGVSKYDGKSFINFTTAQGLPNDIVRSVTEDKNGNLWFGTENGGATKYDGKFFTNFTTAQGLANNRVWSIIEDKTGNLWFSTDGGGVSKYDGKSFTNFTTAQGLANNGVADIMEDKNGNLWFGTFGGGVSKYDGKSFTNFKTTQGLADNIVFSIIEDESGNLWFGTQSGGVSKYDGKSFTSFSTAQGLVSNTVFSIIEDKTGNLWFGTYGGGVSKYDGESFTSFSTTHGLANNTVFSIAEDKAKNLWFGTDGSGVSKYDGKSFTNFTKVHGLVNNIVLSITEDKSGNIWFGTDGGGVSKYDGKSFTSYSTTQGLANNTVWSITEDKTGNLWFGTYGGGVSKYDGKSFTSFSTTQGLANNSVFSIAEDETGNLWFGTYGGGVSKYDGKSFTSFSTAHGLANNSVFSITEDKSGNLWFGTDEGLSLLSKDEKENLEEHIDKAKNKEKSSGNIFKTFTAEDGLPDNFVTHVLQLPDGRMAVGTNLGITFFNLSDDFTSLKDIEVYNSPTGYPIKDVNVGQNCLLVDSKGIMWAGTGSEKTALVRIDYKALRKNKQVPIIVIQNIKVNEENICWYDLSKPFDWAQGKKLKEYDSITTPANIMEEFTDFGKELTEAERNSMRNRFGNITFDGITRFYPLPENLILPYQHNNITFDFNAIETDKPSLVNYQYMLEGYDKDWSPILKKTSATFGNIGEGTYTFKVKAQGPNKVWSEPITYTFKVLAPWYRTWWSYLVYTFLFLAALRIFSKWRERNLKAANEKLEKTVEERTKEVVAEKKEADFQRGRSDELLLNILPEEVAEELKATGKAKAKTFTMVTVLFTDFKDFTIISEKVEGELLVEEIDYCFSAFDKIIAKYPIEKIKTVGDAYICASGMPIINDTHGVDMINAAIEIRNFMALRKKEKEAKGEIPFEIRVGVHTGPLVAGIVGVKKFAYDIWGDTVNLAARMEQNSEAGKINISGSTYNLVKEKFNCVHRGKIQAKNKGEIDMYYVEE